MVVTTLLKCEPTHIPDLVRIKCPLCGQNTTLDYHLVLEGLTLYGAARLMCGACQGYYRVVGHTRAGYLIAKLEGE